MLSPEEFSTALNALSTLSLDDDAMTSAAAASSGGGGGADGGGGGGGSLPLASPGRMEGLRLTVEQTNALVSSLDRNADGVIDYEEFLLALEARDLMQR